MKKLLKLAILASVLPLGLAGCEDHPLPLQTTSPYVAPETGSWVLGVGSFRVQVIDPQARYEDTLPNQVTIARIGNVYGETSKWSWIESNEVLIKRFVLKRLNGHKNFYVASGIVVNKNGSTDISKCGNDSCYHDLMWISDDGSTAYSWGLTCHSLLHEFKINMKVWLTDKQFNRCILRQTQLHTIMTTLVDKLILLDPEVRFFSAAVRYKLAG